MLITLWDSRLKSNPLTGNRMIKKSYLAQFITYNFCCHNSLKLKKKEPLDIENAQYTG